MYPYRFKVEYDGAAYHGWQIQPEDITVQSVLQEKIFMITRQKVHVMGSGRTDAKVHSRGQVARVDLEKKIDTSLFIQKLNSVLPANIAIRDLELCSKDFQPRFDAVHRYYVYTIFTRKVCLGADWGYEARKYKIDPKLMQSEIKLFEGTHDFKNFAIPRPEDKSTLCTILNTKVEIFEDRVQIHIWGNRFLQRMVRSIVGLLIEVARGKLPEGSTRTILSGNFKGERLWAPPQGLNLEEVAYLDY
jgi:tRNA pseudouridine38-40 synthase